MKAKTFSFIKHHTPVTDTVISVAILLTCSLIGLLFYALRLSEANIITVYILGILLISSLTRTRSYGLFASIIGVFLFNCLFAEPRFNFLFYDPQYGITIFIMLVASLAISYVMAELRNRLDIEVRETRRSEVLLETSQKLQASQTADDVRQVAVTQFHHFLQVPLQLYPYEEGKLREPLCAPVNQPEQTALGALALEQPEFARWLAGEDEDDPVFLYRREQLRVHYYKIQNQEQLFAVVAMVLDNYKSIAPYVQNLIFALLDEVAISLEAQQLHDTNERIARQAEKERLRANLLRTISHDLRTPLTAISGNADILLRHSTQLEQEQKLQMVQSIQEDAEWLISLVENLLFMTRLENGAMDVCLQAELLQELLPESLRHLQKRSAGQRLQLELPEELLFVSVDPRLTMQVIFNLVDNALRYAPADSPVQVRAFRRGEQVLIEVADLGPGIPDAEKEKVFEMFYTADKRSGDGRRGIGLGLGLCQTIVKTQGGEIYIRDNQPQGTVVGFSMQREGSI